MGRPRCLPRWSWKPVMSSDSYIGGIGRVSFGNSWTWLRLKYRTRWRFTSLWITTAPTKPPPSGNGSLSAHAFTSTSHPLTAPGLIWSNAGSPNSRTNASGVAYSAAWKNWKPPFGSTSQCITKTPSPSFGLERQTKSWPVSPVTRSAPPWPNLPNLCHEPLGQETRGSRHLSDLIGKAQLERIRENKPARWFQWKQGSYSTERVIDPVVMDSEIQGLDDLNGYFVQQDKIVRIRFSFMSCLSWMSCLSCLWVYLRFSSICPFLFDLLINFIYIKL